MYFKQLVVLEEESYDLGSGDHLLFQSSWQVVTSWWRYRNTNNNRSHLLGTTNVCAKNIKVICTKAVEIS